MFPTKIYKYKFTDYSKLNLSQLQICFEYRAKQIEYMREEFSEIQDLKDLFSHFLHIHEIIKAMEKLGFKFDLDHDKSLGKIGLRAKKNDGEKGFDPTMN